MSLVGKPLEVRHSTRDGKYRPCKAIMRKIAAVYGSGMVRDNCGDVWRVTKKGEKYVTTG